GRDEPRGGQPERRAGDGALRRRLPAPARLGGTRLA
ncbi:MAG: hypothetical protein AVDCRST_MAG30-4334, partial [uncultured Solirubrobacteraceae bacterium]